MQRETNISFEIPTTPPVRPSRPSPGRGVTTTASISSRSPRIPLRPSIQTTKTISTPSPRTRYTLSKSPEPLRSVTGTVTRPRPIQATVTKSSRMTTRTSPSPVVPPRVSDLDSIMAKTKANQRPQQQEAKSVVKPSPLTGNICRSLFTANVVKVVRPVRSQELKIFSCPNTENSVSLIVDQHMDHSNTDESTSTLTIPSIPHDLASPTTHVPRDLSEDSLNEHHHIKQLLQTSNFLK